MWPSAKTLGIIYYQIGSLPANITTAINNGIAQWNATSVGIKWQPLPAGSTQKYATIVGGTSGSVIELYLNQSNSCGTPAFAGGGIGYSEGLGGFPVGNTIYLNPACFNYYTTSTWTSTVQHEMGHVTGLWHEQQRCGRANYVTVAPGNWWDGNYLFNWAEKCDSNASNYGYYDFKSIMHYAYFSPYMAARTPANTQYCGNPIINNESAVGSNPVLSPGDINAINRLYSRGPISSTGC